jgi:hypothetical protein
MDSTTRLLESIGATAGPVYGRYPDKTVYRWLLEGRTDVFVQLTSELADAFVAAGVEHVAGDAMEGFNPVHDVWRLMVDGAVAGAIFGWLYNRIARRLAPMGSTAQK